nr:uncharacterized protein LOC110374694 isoform X1 [Helicoverpa armigera]
MESVGYNPEEQQKPIFTLAGETNHTSTTDSFPFPDTRNAGNQDSVMPISALMQGLGGGSMLPQQEPRVADSAPSMSEMEEMMMNIHLNGSTDLFNEDAGSNYFTGYNSSRSDASPTNAWLDSATSNLQISRSSDAIDVFDFLMKSLSSANNFLSTLTREQTFVLKSIRPSLLYEFLQEVAKARSDRRVRRALPNECAFCKNNGENEECYSSHALKDWRGRVLCPVLRAFRCPRCGATGDRAHTIKYCPESPVMGTSAAGLASRRRIPPSTSLLLNAPRSQTGTATPSASPVTSQPNPMSSYTSLWTSLGLQSIQ